jgi:polyhydroxyalkanoate synthesis repressor PhaR
MRIIKRYSNRRLYDTETKKTIKITDIVQLVKRDIKFKVIDNSTKKDITTKILALAFSEELKKWKTLKDTGELLRELILKGGEISVDIFKKTVLAGIGLFDLTKEKAEKIVDELIKRGELSQSEKAKAIKELLEGHDERMKKIKQKIDESVEKVAAKIKAVKKEDLEELTKRIDQLAKAIEKLEQKLK